MKPTTLKFILLAAGMSIIANDGMAQITARDFCNRGVARQKKGDLNGALADYSRAIEINPQYTPAYNNHGLAEMAKGDLDGALMDYDRALQLSPRNFEIRVNRGVARQKKGDFDGALADYDIAIKLWKTYVPAYRNRAKLKMAQNDLDGALADCNFLLAINPKDASAYYDRAQIKTAKGDPDSARADLNRAIKLDPKYARKIAPEINKLNVESAAAPDEHGPAEANANNPDTEKNPDLATQKIDDLKGAGPEPEHAPPIAIEPVPKQKNDDHEAVVHHQPAIEIHPQTADVRDGANVGKKTGVGSAESSPTVELASKNIETSTRLELGKPVTGDLGGGVAEIRGTAAPKNLTLSGDLNVGKQNHDLSGVSIDQHQPATPTATSIPTVADVAKQTKADSSIVPPRQTPTAEPKNLKPPANASPPIPKENLGRNSADYPLAGEREPKSTAGYNDRAYFRKAIGDLDGALADYDRVIERSPNAAAYHERGNIKRAKGDLDGALADYNHAIELKGDNPIAYHNRGVAKQTKGDLDGAIADFTTAIQLDPKNGPAYRSRGAARTNQGDFDGALTDYNRAIELSPQDGDTYYNRADLFFSVRKWDAALEDFNRFFELSQAGQEYPRAYVWLILARTGQTGAANKELVDYLRQRGNPADWFSKVASYLLGKISDADLLAAVKSSDKKSQSGQLCEAWFYIGMKKLIGGNKSGAQDCFSKSVETGQKEYTEYHFARAELKALLK